VLTTQVNGAYAGLSADDALRTSSPTNRSGPSAPASPPATTKLSRRMLSCAACWPSSYGDNVAQSISIQYGGSMKPENAAGLLAQKDIDGGLIGGAALKADSFLGIVTPSKPRGRANWRQVESAQQS
jgi:triosephosphate isomerase